MANKTGLDGLIKGINDATRKINDVKRSSSNLQKTIGMGTNRNNSSNNRSSSPKNNNGSGWLCSCGVRNTTKFCGGCGQAQNTETKCPNCNWVRPSGSENMKFCGECGTALTAGNVSNNRVNRRQTGNAGLLRFFAFLFWILALGSGISAILIISDIWSIDSNFLIWFYAALGLDLLFVIIGSLLWKKSNRIDPASSSNKIKFWLWNNMGLIIAVIAFFPVIIVLLKTKNLDPKTKKLATAIATIAFIIAGFFGVEWDPVSAEDFLQNTTEQLHSENVNFETVYWTNSGRKIHLANDCQSLARSSSIMHGTIDDAVNAKLKDLCNFCTTRFGINN